MKKIIAMLLAASIIVNPVAAETKNQCAKADMLTGAVIGFVIAYASVWLMSKFSKAARKFEREEIKKKHPECKID